MTAPRHLHRVSIGWAYRLLVVGLVVCTGLVGLPDAPNARGQTGPVPGGQVLQWDDYGSTFKVFGAGESVVIALGKATPGTCDGFYSATDVYVVDQGAFGNREKLRDVSNVAGVPNTVFLASPGGLFIETTIGRGPYSDTAGTVAGMAPGVYGVVYDECQNGAFNPLVDTVFYPAFSIEVATEVPVLNLGVMKANAKLMQLRMEFSIRFFHEMIDEVTKLSIALSLLSCAAANPAMGLFCLAKEAADYAMYETIKLAWQLGLGLHKSPQLLAEQNALSSAAMYRGIAADPPDSDFAEWAVPEPVAPLPSASGDPLSAAYWTVASALGNEAATGDALLTSLEKYQGAAAAGDGEWSLAQARAARAYAALMADQLDEGNPALEALMVSLDDDGRRLDEVWGDLERGREAIATRGFTRDEVRELTALGATGADLIKLEAGLSDEDFRFETDEALATLDELVSRRFTFRNSLYDLLDELDGTIGELEADATVFGFNPVTVPDGPYPGDEGLPVVLDGSGSYGLAAEITSWDWDLDADGKFDDATGPLPTASFPDGLHPIGLMVTDQMGQTGIAYTHAMIEDTDAPPSLAATPDRARVAVLLGSSVAFGATADDPEGGPVTIEWFLDFTPAGDGPSFSYAPSGPGSVGPHFVSVHASDPAGQSIEREWEVAVLAEDLDGDGWRANADCDDGHPAINPGMYEAIGDGVDNDCDASTPDAGSPPEARFYAAPAPALAGDTVTFADLSSDANGPIVSWSWDFGDGATSTEQHPTHVFTTPGTQAVHLEVIDEQGESASIEKNVLMLTPPTSGSAYGFIELDAFITDPAIGVPRSPYADPAARLYARNDLVTASGLTPWLPAVQCDLAGAGVPGYTGAGDVAGSPPEATVWVVADDGSSFEAGTVLEGVAAPITGDAEGSFSGEVIASTAPGGLEAGRYDVVLDHCQDGVFNPSLDVVIGNGPGYGFAVTDEPGGLPEIQLNYLRERSLSAAYSLVSPDGAGLCAAVSDLADAGAGPVGFDAQAARLIDACDDLADAWMGIATGSPEEIDDGLARLGPIAYEFASDDDDLVRAVRTLANLFEEQAEAVIALDTTLGRFRGAYAADSHLGMWRQIDHVGELNDLLVGGGGNLLRSYAWLERLDDALSEGPLAGLTEAAVVRTAATGVRRGVGALLDPLGPRFRVWRSCHLPGGDVMFPLGLQAWVIAYTTTDFGYLSSGIVSIPSYRQEQGLPPLDPPYPDAATTGPYLSPPGRTTDLDATGSSDPQGDALTYRWDLDGDADFADGTLATLGHAFTEGGTRVIGLEATDPAGHDDLAYVRYKAGDTSNQSIIVARHLPRQLWRVDPDGTSTMIFEAPTNAFGGITDPVYGGSPVAIEVQPGGDFYLINSSGGLVHFDASGTALRRMTVEELSDRVGFTVSWLTDLAIDGRGHLILAVEEEIWPTSHAGEAILDIDPEWEDIAVLAHGEYSAFGGVSLAIAPDGAYVLGGMRDLAIGDWTHLKGQGSIYGFDPDTGDWDQLLPAYGAHLEDGTHLNVRLAMGGADLNAGSNRGNPHDSGVQVDARGDLIFSDQFSVYRVPMPAEITEHPVTSNQRLIDVEAFLAYRGIAGGFAVVSIADLDLDAAGDYLIVGWDTDNRVGVYRVTPDAEYFKVADLGSPADFPSHGTASLLGALGVVPEVREVTARDVPAPQELRIGTLTVGQESCPGDAELRVAMHNVGNGEATDPVTVHFFDGDPLAGGLLIGSATDAGPIPAAGSVELTLLWPDPAPGSHEVFAVAVGAGTAASAHTVCVGGPGGAGGPGGDVPPLVLWPDDQTRPVGTFHEVAVPVRDLAGTPVPGAEVLFEVTGAHGFTATRTADAWGTARLRYTGSWAGTDDIVAHVGDAYTNHATVTWFKPNTSPTATARSLETYQDRPLLIRLAGEDPDGDRLSFAVESQPEHGTLWGSPPEVVYAPDPGFSGTDAFTFTAHDGVAGSPAATIGIEVVPTNAPPVADAGGPYQVDEGGSLTVSGAASTDPDGDLLAYEWDLDGDGVFETAGMEPVFSAAGMDGPGSVSVTLRVVDPGALDDEASAAVTIHNVAPTVTGPAVIDLVDEGSPVIAAVEIDDPGPDGPFVCTVDYGDTTGPSPGTVSGDTCVGDAHFYADDATYEVIVAVTDKDGATSSVSIPAVVGNAPPTVDAGTDRGAFAGDLVGLDSASFHDQGTLDTHEATVEWGDGSPPEAAVVVEAPFGPPGSLHGADGTIDAGHTYADPGVFTVTVCVADDDEPAATACDTATATIVPRFLGMAVFGGPGEHGKAGKVTVGHDAVVDGWVGATGQVKLGHDTVATGSVVSVSDRVTIEKDSTVGGDVIAGTEVHLKKGVTVAGAVLSGEDAKVHDDATVAGGVTVGAAPYPELTWFAVAVPEQRKDEKVAFDHEAALLSPGDYGKVEAKHGSLTLQAGVYRIYDLKTNDAELLIDLDPDGDGTAGSLVVWVSHDVDLHGAMRIVSPVGDASGVLFVVGHKVDLHDAVSYLGTFLSAVGDIKVHKDATVDGALYGHKVDLHEGVHVTARPAIDPFVGLYVPVIP